MNVVKKKARPPRGLKLFLSSRRRNKTLFENFFLLASAVNGGISLFFGATRYNRAAAEISICMFIYHHFPAMKGTRFFLLQSLYQTPYLP